MYYLCDVLFVRCRFMLESGRRLETLTEIFEASFLMPRFILRFGPQRAKSVLGPKTKSEIGPQRPECVLRSKTRRKIGPGRIKSTSEAQMQ